MSRAALLVFVGCASAPVVREEVPYEGPHCKLVTPATAVTPLAVDGYPMPFTHLSPKQLEARRDALEKLVPGWELELNQDGFIAKAISGPIGKYEQSLSAERLARMQALVTTLHEELALPADVKLVNEHGPAAVVRDAKNDWIISASLGSASGARRRDLPPQGREELARQQIAVLEVKIQHPRTTPLPNFPTTATELTDTQLVETWHLTGEVQLQLLPRQMQCDPVGPNDCRQAQRDAAVACLPVVGLRFPRTTMDYLGMVRRVVALVSPDRHQIPFDYGRGGEAPDGYTQPIITPAIPRCFDAYTGENLTGQGWCSNLN